MKFEELKQILSNEHPVILYDDDDNRLEQYTSNSMDDRYDDCDVYMLGIRTTDFGTFAFEVHVVLPTWTVEGTMTVDVEFSVKAISEDDVLDKLDDIKIIDRFGDISVECRGDYDASIITTANDIDWDTPEIL